MQSASTKFIGYISVFLIYILIMLDNINKYRKNDITTQLFNKIVFQITMELFKKGRKIHKYNAEKYSVSYNEKRV